MQTTNQSVVARERTLLEAFLFGSAVILAIATAVFVAIDLLVSVSAGRFEVAEWLLATSGLLMSAGLWFLSRLLR